MHRTFLQLGALFGLLSVALGAMGAHALRDRLTPQDLTTFETAARYQMYHALALLAVALLAGRVEDKRVFAAGWCFVAGVLVFSGSLYALALTGVKALGAITPLGGVAFMAGWGLLALASGAGAHRAQPHADTKHD
ncbi:MAG TPA: DUF423 domain-containing protein [Fimbriimonadaceae bacterium]|nr:DUF423 domain-containing protein [Fimbriimonadaceae bacterium]